MWVGLILAIAGFTQSSNSAGNGNISHSTATVVKAGLPPGLVASRPGWHGTLLRELRLAASSNPDHRFTPEFAVVPIIINTGAALFPTIMAFLANIAAVVFNPKALGRFLRLRWRLVAAVTASLALLVFAGIRLWRPAPISRTETRAGLLPSGQINWAKVAENLIAQEKLHQADAAPVRVAAGASGSLLVSRGRRPIMES